MIVYHQSNLAAFAGNHVYYGLEQTFVKLMISVTTAAAPPSGWGPRIGLMRNRRILA